MKLLQVGNDVVDLEDPRTVGRATDERFVARVFSAGERAAIEAADDPDLEVWTVWAAKEAGFKALSKLMGEVPPFVHRRFEVRWTSTTAPSDAAESTVREGIVGYAERRARVWVVHRPGGVHAVAFGVREGIDAHARERVRPKVALLDAPHSRWSGSLEELSSRLSEQELDAVHSRQSAAVRLGARGDLAVLLDVDEGRLEIVCAPGQTGQRPPRVLLDGRQAGADVSLSHDGRWIAWATWVANGTGSVS